MTLALQMAPQAPQELTGWLPQDVAERLRDAAKTLQRLPMPRYGCPGDYRSTMPDPLVNFWEMWNGLTAAEREERQRELNRTRIPSTSRDIQRMDEVLNWLLWLDSERDRKVVMAKAGGTPYRKISFFDGRSREHLRQVWVRSCELIAKRLNDGG